MVSSVVFEDVNVVANNTKALEGAVGAEFLVDIENIKFNAMADSYKANYNTDIVYSNYAQAEYDAVYMLHDAIVAVGYDGTKLAGWLRSVKDWGGASGEITIDPATGDRTSGYVTKVTKSGKIELLVKH